MTENIAYDFIPRTMSIIIFIIVYRSDHMIHSIETNKTQIMGIMGIPISISPLASGA